jgi:hypothetical protein
LTNFAIAARRRCFHNALRLPLQDFFHLTRSCLSASPKALLGAASAAPFFYKSINTHGSNDEIQEADQCDIGRCGPVLRQRSGRGSFRTTVDERAPGRRRAVLLAGGVNLMREPRNGRNFEYGGEDPLLAGKIVGAQIKGIQSNRVVSTLKHFALNDQETGRTTLNVKIDDQSARMCGWRRRFMTSTENRCEVNKIEAF